MDEKIVEYLRRYLETADMSKSNKTRILNSVTWVANGLTIGEFMDKYPNAKAMARRVKGLGSATAIQLATALKPFGYPQGW